MAGSNEAGVSRVISFLSSSNVYPTASFAAIFAMGKPVALEASAEERDTRGFISMTTRRPVAGSTANWMFEPPVSTPISRMTAIAASRMSWYSLSVSVCAGATVMESPVWTPMGSTFSMEQMMTTLSLRSRITSSSNSFQPITDSSTSTCWLYVCWFNDCTPPEIYTLRLHDALPIVGGSIEDYDPGGGIYELEHAT